MTPPADRPLGINESGVDRIRTQTSLARIEAHVSNLIPRLDDLRDDLKTVREENKETLVKVEGLSSSVSNMKLDMVTHAQTVAELQKEAEDRRAAAKTQRARIWRIVVGILTAVGGAVVLTLLGLSK